MKDYEKAIEEAAYKHSHSRLNNGYYTFLEGAKSQAAKEFHQQGMFTQEDILEFAWFLKNNLGQTSNDQFAHFQNKYYLDLWLKQNKKKESTVEPEEKLIKVYDNLGGHPGGHWEYAHQSKEWPIGSYEAENKVADCVEDDSCRELCKTCINYTK